jgi:hypothetical protein
MGNQKKLVILITPNSTRTKESCDEKKKVCNWFDGKFRWKGGIVGERTPSESLDIRG